MSEQFVSLETFGQGAAIEMFNDELERVLANVQDPNTKATVKRKITMTLTIEPDEDRTFARTTLDVASKLAPSKPFGQPIYIGKHAGKAVATERDTRQLTFEDNVKEMKGGAK